MERKNKNLKKLIQKFKKILSSFDRQALHAKSLGFFHPVKKSFLILTLNYLMTLKKY